MKKFKTLLTLCAMTCVLAVVSSCSVLDTVATKIDDTLHDMLNRHAYSTEWKNDETNHWLNCTVDGCDKADKKAAHTYDEGKVTTAATEETAGVMTYKCKVCGYEKTETIDKLAHTHKLYRVAEVEATCTENGTEAYYACSGCDEIFADGLGKTALDAPVTIEAGHSWEAATCTEPKTCSECSATEGEKLGHTPMTAVTENEVAPTCGKDGSYDTVVYCKACDEEISRETKTVPATGEHVYVIEAERVPATCTEDGYVIKKCSCGAEDKTTLAAPGHTPKTAVKENEKATSCTAAGSYDSVVYCSVCNEELSRTTVTVDKLDHTPAAAAKENEKATSCTAAGSYDSVVYCSVCGGELSRTTVTVDKLDHTPAAAAKENEKAATCGAAGSYDMVVRCSVCKEVLSSETTTVPATSQHVYDNDQDADCNNGCGYVRDVECTHANTKVLSAVAATCTSTGLTEGLQCEDCEEILTAQTVTERLAHTPADAVRENEQAASCTKEGSYESVVYCSVCKTAELSRTPMTIPMADHTYGEDNICDVCNVAKITVSGGTADKTIAYAGDTVTLTADAAVENQAFSHWMLNGEAIEGNTFTMPEGVEAKVVAVFVDTVRTLATPNNSASKLIYKESSGAIALDRSGTTMFATGVDHVVFYVYESADVADENKEKDCVAKFVLRITNAGTTFSASIETLDGSKSFNIVRGGKGNYYIHIDSSEITPFYNLLKDLIGYRYSNGNNYYYAAQAIACSEPVDENGIAITYLDSEISVIGSTGMVQTSGATSGVYTLKVDGGLIENEYTQLAVGGGRSVSLTTEGEEGYFFKGWYLADENGEATGNVFSASFTYTYTVTGDATLKAVYTQEMITLATPNNSESKLIYREDGGAIAFDRAESTMFAAGVDYVLYYVYASADAEKDDYIAQFKLNRYDGSVNIDINTSIETMDGVKYECVRGGKGVFWISPATEFYNMLSDIIDECTDGQTYYFAAQAIATEEMKNQGYTDSDISEIGETGIVYNASYVTEKYTVNVVNGTIDGTLTSVTVWKGWSVTVTAAEPVDDEVVFTGWKEVSYDAYGAEILGETVSNSKTYTFSASKNVTLKAVYANKADLPALATPNNGDNYLIYKESVGSWAFDRAGKSSSTDDIASVSMFNSNVDYVIYYLYNSSDADKNDYVGRFMLKVDITADAKGGQAIVGYLSLLDGSNKKEIVRGHVNDYYCLASNHSDLVSLVKAALGENYSSGKGYYFACQAISNNVAYLNSEISAISTVTITF